MILVGVGIAAGITLLCWPDRGEPVYGGKSLARWLKQLDDGRVSGISFSELPSPTARQIEAAQAIRVMGAEAIPLLMRDIHAGPSPNSIRYMAQVHSVKRTLEWYLGNRMGSPDVTEEDIRRWRAAQGLAALGPLAKSELPELKRLLFTNYFHSSIREAAYVLAAVGPEGIQILTNAPQADEWPGTWSGTCAIWALGQHPAAGTNVIPFLISATSSRDAWTAYAAIRVLGLFHTQADQVIPALTNALTRDNPGVRAGAAQALGAFGPQAVSAVGLLQTLTNGPTEDAAREALQRIEASAPPRSKWSKWP